MSEVVLRKLAITDLSVVFARPMEGNKIRHYCVPYSMTVLGRNPLKMVKEHILREENKEESELEFIMEASASLLAPTSSDGALQIEEVPSILSNDLAVKKALLKRRATSQIHQTTIFTFKEKLINHLVKIVNPLIQKINRALQSIQRLNDEDVMYDKGLFIPVIDYRFGRNVWNLVRYLSVAFESPHYKEAQEALLKDLRILQENDLILGHLSMPSLIALADTVGSGHQRCALFCFVLVDEEKLTKLVGLDLTDRGPRLRHLGIVTENFEGAINDLNGISLADKYDIERVTVTEQSHEEIVKAARDAFNASIPSVNQAARVTKALLKVYPDEFAKAERELTNAAGAAHEKALLESRKQVARQLTKKPSKRKKVTKKPSKRKKVTKKGRK